MGWPGLVAEDIDRSVRLLTDVDDVLHAGVAEVVDAIREKHDEVTLSGGGGWGVDEFVAAGDVKSVEECGAAETAGGVECDGIDAGGEGIAVTGPVLFDERFEVKAHDECLVGVEAQDVRTEIRCDLLVATQTAANGSTGVDDDAGSDLAVGAVLEVEDTCGLLAVIQQAKVGELKVVDGATIFVDGTEGEVHFVDGYWKSVRCCGIGFGDGI